MIICRLEFGPPACVCNISPIKTKRFIFAMFPIIFIICCVCVCVCLCMCMCMYGCVCVFVYPQVEDNSSTPFKARAVQDRECPYDPTALTFKVTTIMYQ